MLQRLEFAVFDRSSLDRALFASVGIAAYPSPANLGTFEIIRLE